MTAATVEWDGAARQPCPECGRGPRDRTLGVTVDHDGRGVAHCFRCGYVETRHGDRTETRPGTRQTPAAAPIRHEVLSDYGRELWDACGPIYGVALDYLQARHCVIPPADGDLRYHPALKHPASDYSGPALVALITDAVTRAPLSLHRTWIKSDGTKVGDPPRMLLGGHRKAGGVIRLWPDESVSTGLCIAEGVETALSVAHSFTPVWACIDAGNLAAFPVLPGIECLTIAADHDDASLKAAQACAGRWIAAGVDCIVTAPCTARQDWNDLRSATWA